MNLLSLTLGLALIFAAANDVSQLETRIKTKPQDLPARELLAKIYSQKQLHDDVIRTLAPYSNEISMETIQILADAYRAKKEFEKEVLALTIYLEREPKRFRPHYLIGRALKDAGKIDEAVTQLRQSIALAPKHLPSYETLLAIFNQKKQNYESRLLLNDMIRVFGERKSFLNELCALYIHDSFLAEARNTCQKAIKKDPRFPDNHVHLAQSFRDMDNKKSSEKVFIVAARQFPKSEYVQWSTGEFYYQDSNYPIAVRYLKQAVKADPKSARSQLALAMSHFESNNYTEALPHYYQACILDDTKVALESFRVATGKLRHKNHIESETYERELSKCERM